MKNIDRIKLALQGVGSNKFRSFLTLLGIIIGVSAVILMVSLGSGTQQVISGQFSGLYARQIYLAPDWNLPYTQRGRLYLEDEKYLEGAAVGIEDAVPFYQGRFSVKLDGREEDNTIVGVTPGALELANLHLKYGRSITEADLKKRERAAIVGERFLERLTNRNDYSSLIGDEIEISGEKFIVIGIIAESDSAVTISDRSILVPQTTYRMLWRRNVEQVSHYIITYNKETEEKDIISQVQFLLGKKYGQANGKSRFAIQGLQGQKDMMDNIIRALTYVLGGIAAISLLVGGIGVMNIMLVTVKERTREIGLRLAIGADSREIQIQFLLEGIILTVGGGLLGVITGSLLSVLVSMGLKQAFDWWQGGIPLWIIFLSFAVTVFIGLTFGFYPAYKASKLDPIEALSYE